jgi:hypothetical protein
MSGYRLSIIRQGHRDSRSKASNNTDEDVWGLSDRWADSSDVEMKLGGRDSRDWLMIPGGGCNSLSICGALFLRYSCMTPSTIYNRHSSVKHSTPRTSHICTFQPCALHLGG